MLSSLKKEDSWFIRIGRIKELLTLMIEVLSLGPRKADLGIEVPVLGMVEKLILQGLKETILELEIISFPVFGIAIDFLI